MLPTDFFPNSLFIGTFWVWFGEAWKMCLMCGRMKRDHCSPGFKDYQLRMWRFQEKEREREKGRKNKKKLEPCRKRTECQANAQGFLRHLEAIVSKPQDSYCHIPKWCPITANGTRRSHTRHAQPELCLCYPGWISGSSLFFHPALLEEEKGTDEVEWVERCGCQLCSGQDEEHTQYWRLIASPPMFWWSHCPSTINSDKVIGLSVL